MKIPNKINIIIYLQKINIFIYFINVELKCYNKNKQYITCILFIITP